MDNGLIFPYPLTRANAEPSDANHFNRFCGSLLSWRWKDWDPRG